MSEADVSMERQESSDDEYQPSEATILFAEEVNKEFKRAFPLKAETEKLLEKRRRETLKPLVCKKLNFDETLSPIAIQADMKRSTIELSSMKSRLDVTEQEVKRLKDCLERKSDDIERLISENEKLRMENVSLKTEFNNEKLDLKKTSLENMSSLENWKIVANKYYLWYNMINNQMELIKSYMENGGRFDNQEEVNNINRSAMQYLLDKKDNTLCSDDLDSLVRGSLLDVPIIEIDCLPQQSLEDCRVDETNMTLINAPNTSEMTVLDDTAISNVSNSTIFNNTSILTGGGRERSIIDYEKDEKIQRLLLENSMLKDRITASKGKVDRLMLMEEKNRTLEQEKNVLKQRLDSSFNEIETMRIGTARSIFTVDDELTDSNISGKALKMVDRMNRLVAENRKMEKEYEAATSKITSLSMKINDYERRNNRLEEVYSMEVGKTSELQKELNEVTIVLQSKDEKISELNQKLDEALSGKTSQQPTDAGDTTQILHMNHNPLESAHNEFQAAESRKRKLDDLESTLTDGDVKKKRDELVNEMEDQLRSLQHEKNVLEEAYDLHKDLANKFRQVCLALTGLQIKLKDPDEGICTVQSEYEAGTERQFVFKCFYGTTRIDMLDVNCSSSNDILETWEPYMRKYIGERNSIPAFLAAVTLKLEQNRVFDETMCERTHTFSVLQED